MIDSRARGAGLAAFLRARRARVRPADVGLPVGTGPRRIPGLRREELATLAGVSIDYYVRLEQGRETNPSGAVLAALAGALRLDEEATAHLYALANHASARLPEPPRPEARTVRPGILRLLANLRPCPAYVLGRVNDVLAANPEGLALLAGIADWPARRRNTIRYVFRHPAARTVFADWTAAAEGSVAHLRTVVAADPAAADLAALVAELTGASPEFRELWERYDVHHRRGEHRSFHHPEVGAVTFLYEVLTLDDGQRLTLYQTEPGTPDHDAMTLLGVLARQQKEENGVREQY